MVGETEVKERPKSNPDYLMQLMNDRKVMSSLPNFSGIFTHLERLLDEGNPGLPLHLSSSSTLTPSFQLFVSDSTLLNFERSDTGLIAINHDFYHQT